MQTLSLLLGLFVLGVVGFASRPSRTATPSQARRGFGWLLVAVPLPLALALHLFLPLEPTIDRLAFVVGAVAFALGALLVLPASDDEPPEEASDDGDQPPWWPEFERDFRAYVRGPRPGRVRGSLR